jgi:hypothetical protein
VSGELRQFKVLLSSGEAETAEHLAKFRGGLTQTAYVKALIAEDAERWISELRRLSWEAARQDEADTPAEAPPQPLATGANPPQGA